MKLSSGHAHTHIHTRKILTNKIFKHTHPHMLTNDTKLGQETDWAYSTACRTQMGRLTVR